MFENLPIFPRIKDPDLEVREDSIAQMVRGWIEGAYDQGASDLHLEPMAQGLRVRWRVDGVLQEVQGVPKILQSAVTNYLKMLSRTLDIAQQHLPQEGLIFMVHRHGHRMALRLSSLPSVYGESLVLRILDGALFQRDAAVLGFSMKQQQEVERWLRFSEGMVIITGPTGSGKTTTLYAFLNCLNQAQGLSQRKLITLEDPCEYPIPGVNQVNIRSDRGLTFSQALRAALRQAPNVILIGEIRDSETAHLALQASLTGHLVLTTLHTSDACCALLRLMDLGLSPVLLAQAIRGVLAQCLVRCLCPFCRDWQVMSAALALRLYVDLQVRIPKSQGCLKCQGQGYRGRLGVFELLPFDPLVADCLLQHASLFQLRKQAAQLGIKTLRQEALEKVWMGVTSLEEVLLNT